MGYDLTSTNGDSLRFGGTSWTFVLNLAELYGWQPSGTEPPDEFDATAKWDGCYDTNDGQCLKAHDATALANAVAIAATDPNLASSVESVAETIRKAIAEHFGEPVPHDYDIGVGDTDSIRAMLHEFAAFCQNGPFIID